jgi:SpoVK/Ycf46/Vps4 family AAA+-type ATPase
MEAFSGITILTTNHESAIDQAFMRRLAFHVRVPMPEERERQLIWRAMIPANAPVAPELDVGRLAQRYVMSGGYIRNAALRAAFMAAEQESMITTAHLERAARLEYEGMGKIAA